MKKEIIDSETNGEPTKVIIRKDPKSGVILDIMIKPNFKKIQKSGLAIGYHFFANPSLNHRDIFWNGSPIDQKDYEIEKAGFSIRICGSTWVI